MPSGRLSLLDVFNHHKKPRETRSFSSLPRSSDENWNGVPVAFRPVIRAPYREIEVEGGLALPARSTNFIARRAPGNFQHISNTNRSRTSPAALPSTVLSPPDGLYLRTVRRRSANAVLEPHRQVRDRRRRRRNDEQYSISLAIACSLPPDYLEQPPEYSQAIAEDSEQPHGRVYPSRSMVVESQSEELFLQPSSTRSGGGEHPQNGETTVTLPQISVQSEQITISPLSTAGPFSPMITALDIADWDR